MAATEMWATIKAERIALGSDLERLPDERWDVRSLCGRWSVRDVLAHMTATAKTGPGQFFGRMMAAGFRFDKMADKALAAELGERPSITLARFEAAADSRKHPPAPSRTWLGETIVHAEDIRRPLGIEHDYPIDAVIEVADFYKGSNALIGAKKRIDGVTLRATDADWSHGTGPEAAGPLLSLLMVMTGRPIGMSSLSGDGVATLRTRLS